MDQNLFSLDLKLLTIWQTQQILHYQQTVSYMQGGSKKVSCYTEFRCEYFILMNSAAYLRIQKWKNYWNRSVFAKVIHQRITAYFFGPTLYTVLCATQFLHVSRLHLSGSNSYHLNIAYDLSSRVRSSLHSLSGVDCSGSNKGSVQWKIPGLEY